MALIDPRDIRFKAVRAGGPGGSRRNRRATKVQLWVNLNQLSLTPAQTKLLKKSLGKRVNGRGEVEVWSETSRSQELNRDAALRKLRSLVSGGLRVPRPRIPTEPTRGAKERRLEHKHRRYEKKGARRAGRKGLS